jgi:hypothetical protein
MRQSPGKKIKSSQYGIFEVLEKVGVNSYRLDLPLYMHIYLIANVEIMKLYESFMLDQESDEQVLPIIEFLALEA